MKARGLKAHLALLREAGASTASFHPNGALASITFRPGAVGPAVAPAKAASERAAEAKALDQERAALAADLGVEPHQLAAVLNQVPELAGVS